MAFDILVAFTNQDGVAFPDSASVNATTPTSTDGTEFVKLMIDNYMFGPQQALLNYAGLTPSGVTESDSASQEIEAIQKGFGVGPGMGVTYWKDGDPSVNGDRVLLLTGQVIISANFAELVAATYVGDGNNGTASAFYKTSDAGGTVRDTAGGFFVLPDLRGYILRGLDTAASIDPDGASRDLGSIQLDAMQGHWHEFFTANATPSANDYIDHNLGSRSTSISAVFNKSVEDPITDGVNGTPRTDSETRMINIATNYGITY